MLQIQTVTETYCSLGLKNIEKKHTHKEERNIVANWASGFMKHAGW